MNRGKRLVSVLLTVAILICSIPLGAAAESISLTVATWEGMTLSDIVSQLNSGADLKPDASGWTYKTTGKVKYTYSKIEANAGDVMPGMGWMDVTGYLPQYPDLQAEAEKQLTAKENTDAAKSEKYVPLNGTVETVSSFVYTLPNKVNYMNYSAGARATLSGTITYAALNPAALPASAELRRDGVDYTVTFVAAKAVELVQLSAGGTYQIGASGTDPDYVALTVSAVIDMENSSFGDGAINADGFTVELFDDGSGEFRSVTEMTPVMGTSYRVRVSYQGIIFSDSLEVQVIYTDNRAIVHAVFTDGTLDAMYDTPEKIGAQVFDQLLELNDSTGSLTAADMEFEYYGSFDYSGLLGTAIGEELKMQMRDAIAKAFDESGSDTMTGMEPSVLTEVILTDAWIADALSFEAWVPFGGGSHILTAEIAGQTVTLAEIVLPAIGAGNYRIRATMKGTALVFPFAAESKEAVLTVHAALSDLTVGSNGAVSKAPVMQIAVSMEGSGIYVTLPEAVELFKLTAGQTTVDAGALYLAYLTQTPATLQAMVSIYRNEIMSTPILAQAFAGDGAVLEFLFSSYFGGALAERELMFEEPDDGNYLVIASIGDRNNHASLALGPMRKGNPTEQTCYLSLSGGALSMGTEEPQTAGQHWALRFGVDGVSMTAANRELAQTVLKPDMPKNYVYDGQAHGAPILVSGGVEVAMGDGDVVRYINTLTGKVSESAPSDAGTYLVRVYHRGSTTELLSYTFTIETAKVNVSLPTVEITYGEKLPEIKPIFGEGAPEVLPSYRIDMGGYEGNAGTYELTLKILGTNPGYEYIMTAGRLTVNKLKVSVKVDDKNLVYGDAVNLSWTVTEGTVPSGFILPLAFSETPRNAGEYEITVSCSDANIALTAIAGKIVIAKKKLTLTINTQTLLFGQVPEFTTTPAWTDPDVKIEYTIEKYKEKPGTYAVSAKLSDDTNYDVTFVPGKVTFEQIKTLIIRADSVTAQWGEKPILSATAYAFKAPNMIEVPTVGLEYKYTVKDANGEVVNFDEPLEIGVYDIEVVAVGSGLSNYPTIRYSGGSLTVVKKQITLGVEDVEIVYGDDTYKAEEHALPVDLPEGLEVQYLTPAYKNVGMYSVEVTVSGEYDTTHYEVQIVGGTLTVVPKAITVTPESGQHKVQGIADPELKWTADGLLEGDVLEGKLTRVSGEEPGSYAIRIGTLGNPNYTITLTPATFLVIPAGVKAIQIASLPYKLEYLYGEALEIAGLGVMLVFENGTTEPLDRSVYRVEGYNANLPGQQTVTIAYGPFSTGFTVNVVGGDIVFSDGRFTVDGDYLVIDSVNKSVKLQELLDAMPEGYTAVLYKGEAEQKTTARVGTSMTLEVRLGDAVLKTLTIRVRGDVNGDGRLTQTDSMLILQYVVGKAELNENAALAADVIAIGRVTQTDSMQILRWVLDFDRA